jgi:hypothetical protein
MKVDTLKQLIDAELNKKPMGAKVASDAMATE